MLNKAYSLELYRGRAVKPQDQHNGLRLGEARSKKISGRRLCV